jgi:hypothetical protein
LVEVGRLRTRTIVVAKQIVPRARFEVKHPYIVSISLSGCVHCSFINKERGGRGKGFLPTPPKRKMEPSIINKPPPMRAPGDAVSDVPPISG